MKLLKCFVAQYKTRHIQSKNLEMHILRPKFSEKNTVKVQKQNYVSLINGLKTNFKVQIDLALIHLGSMALLALCAPPPKDGNKVDFFLSKNAKNRQKTLKCP